MNMVKLKNMFNLTFTQNVYWFLKAVIPYKHQGTQRIIDCDCERSVGLTVYLLLSSLALQCLQCNASKPEIQPNKSQSA
jgi:hypothetical protein